ncbi:MAG: hypothetical protein NVS3B25_21370 [Hymenobacter sp.]
MAGFSTLAAQGTATSYALAQADTAYLDFDFFSKHPDLLPTVYESWDNKGFVDLLAITGREEVIYSEIFSNYETGLIPRSFAVASVIAGQTASTAVVTLTADSYTTVNSATGTIARSPLKENDIVKLPNRKDIFVQNKTSVNGGVTGTATQYTFVRGDLASDSTFDLGAYMVAAVTSGQRFAITSAAFAEGSLGALEGVENPIIRYTGQLQICKTHSEITGSAAGDKWEVTLPGGVNRWYSKQRIEQGINHRLDEGLQMLIGRGGNYTDKNGKKVKASMGLEGYVRAYGNVYDLPMAGATASDLDALTARIKTIQGGTEYQWIMGSELYRQIGAVIRSQPSLQGGGVQYNMFGKSNAAQKAVDLGFNSIVWNGITIHLQESPVFNHPELLGLAGYDYLSMGFLIPGAKTRITASDNGVSAPLSFDAESMRIRYKEDVGGKSRRYMTYDLGIEITNIDATKHEMLSHFGLQMIGLRRFIVTQKGTV